MSMSRDYVIAALKCEIKYIEDGGITPEGDAITMDIETARAALGMLEHSEPIVNAVWEYYTNDEGKARWRCSKCGKLCRRDPHDKKRCSSCGAHMTKEA